MAKITYHVRYNHVIASNNNRLPTTDLRSKNAELRVAHFHSSPVVEVTHYRFVIGRGGGGGGGLLVDDLELERSRRQILVGKETALEDLSESRRAMRQLQ